MGRLPTPSQHPIGAALRGRPDIWEVGARDAETDAIAFREDPTGRIDRDLQSDDLVRQERNGIGEGISPGGIENALRDKVRAPVWPDLAKPNDESHDARRGGDMKDGHRTAKDREILRERRRVVD